MFQDDADKNDVDDATGQAGVASPGPFNLGNSGWQAGDFHNGFGLLGMVPPTGSGSIQGQYQSDWGNSAPVGDGDVALIPVAGRRGPSEAHARFCQKIYDQDVDECNQLRKPRDKAICQASAAQRYGNCLAGRPLGPLTLPSVQVPVMPVPRGAPPLGPDPFFPQTEPLIPDVFVPA